MRRRQGNGVISEGGRKCGCGAGVVEWRRLNCGGEVVLKVES